MAGLCGCRPRSALALLQCAADPEVGYRWHRPVEGYESPTGTTELYEEEAQRKVGLGYP